MSVLLTLALGGAAYAVTTTTTSLDFSMTPSVTSATTAHGGVVGYGINLQATGGFSDNVTLSVDSGGLPAGATATFGTNPAFVDSSLASASTLWIDTGSAQPGTYPFTVTGTDGGGTAHKLPLTLVISQSTTQDFSLEITPTTQYVSAGGYVTYTVKAVPVNGFGGSIVLSASSVPGAVSLGWALGSTTSTTTSTAQNQTITLSPGQTATLKVASTLTNPPGSYAITITGTSGSLSHTVAGTLDIDLFSASVTLTDNLRPNGPAVPIPVVLHNPYNFGITVTGLAASVQADSQGVVTGASQRIAGDLPCKASWFAFKASSLSATNTISIPAGGSVTLSNTSSDPNREPTIQMLNDPNNAQDNCENAPLTLNFVGTAQK